MTSLYFCLITAPLPPQEALDRYTALRRQGPAIELKFETRGTRPRLLLVPDQRMRFEAKGPELDYVGIVGPAGFRDFDRISHQYDDSPINKPHAPRSRLVNIGGLFPRWIFAKDLRELVTAKGKFTGLGKRTVRNYTGDAVRGTFSEGGNSLTVDAVIDEAGVPRHLVIVTVSMMGRSREEYFVSRMAPVTPKPSEWVTRIPDGYSPFALSTKLGPAGVKDPFPMQGWTAAKGGALDVKSRLEKGGIVAILGESSVPSQRSRAALDKVRASGVPVVILGDGGAVVGADGYDRTGANLGRLSIPATPVFYRVNAAGKITRAWMGFDPLAASEFIKEATEK